MHSQRTPQKHIPSPIPLWKSWEVVGLTISGFSRAKMAKVDSLSQEHLVLNESTSTVLQPLADQDPSREELHERNTRARARTHTRTHRERHTHKHKEKSDAVNIREPRQIKESKEKRKNGGSNPTALSRLFNPLYISAAAAGTRTQRTGGDDEALQGGVLQLSARTHYRNTLPTLTSEPLGIIIIIIIVVLIIIIIIIKKIIIIILIVTCCFKWAKY